MMYNITFTLGDWSQQGHCISSDYHIMANYSVYKISDAYKNIKSKLGFDFLDNFDDNCWKIPNKEAIKLIELGVIDSDCLYSDEFGYGDINGYYEVDNPEEVICIYFDLVKLELPDFEWEYRNLNEMRLSDLNDSCYGMFYSL